MTPRSAEPAAIARRARALLDLGRTRLALLDVRKGLAQAPTDPELCELLGLCLIRDGQHLEARRALADACAASPLRPHVHYLMGFAAKQLADAHGADAGFREAVRLDPEEPVYLRALAELCSERKLADEALRLANRAVAAGPDRAANWITLGFVVSAAGDRPRAREAYARAVSLDPADATAWNNLGCVDLASGDKLLARERFREALRLEPGSPRTQRNLALVVPARRPPDIYAEFDAFLGEALRELHVAGRLGSPIRLLALGQAFGASAVRRAITTQLIETKKVSRVGLAATAAVGAQVLRAGLPGALVPLGATLAVAGVGYLATLRKVTPLRRRFAEAAREARTAWEVSRKAWLDGELERGPRERRVDRLLERLVMALDRDDAEVDSPPPAAPPADAPFPHDGNDDGGDT